MACLNGLHRYEKIRSKCRLEVRRRLYQTSYCCYPLSLPPRLGRRDEISYTRHSIRNLELCSNVGSLRQCHAALIISGLAGNFRLQTKLLAMYSLLGSFDDGLMVFDGIKDPDFFLWKVLIKGYARNQLFPEILWVYDCMRRLFQDHDNVVFSIALKACVELRSLDQGKQIHCDIVKVGSPDHVVSVGLINLYGQCGNIGDAQKMFVEMPQKDVVAWTSMIVVYMHSGLLREGLNHFNQMLREEVTPNHFTIVSLLSACCQLNFLHQGKLVHSYLIKTGLYRNSFAATALMDLYAKRGNISDAGLIFEQLPCADVVSWTTMIVGCTQRGLSLDALKFFFRMRQAGIVPNQMTIASVLSASAQRASAAGQSIHTLVVLLGIERDCEVSNSLIDMYAKCRMIKDASYVFEGMSHRDLISWNAMINGFSQNRLGVEALGLFHQMRLSKALPDAVTFVGVLSACASLGALETGATLHGYAIKVGLLSNVYVGTALLNLYAKCGSAAMAKRVFDGMSEKNITTWSAMVGGYGMYGDAKNSLALFQDMLKKGVQPNDVVYTSLLSACSHAGMVSEGFKYFEDACSGCYAMPSMKHYGCMIDMLGRAGRIDEALEFIRKMPTEADAGVWGALVNACKIHSKIELGEKAASILLDLQPETGYYVLMSNMYAESGRWEDAASIRALMKERGMKKSPGSSIMEKGNFVL